MSEEVPQIEEELTASLGEYVHFITMTTFPILHINNFSNDLAKLFLDSLLLMSHTSSPPNYIKSGLCLYFVVVDSHYIQIFDNSALFSVLLQRS